MLEALRQDRAHGGRASASPDLSEEDVRLSAVATVTVAGQKIKVPFVEADGEWRLDSLYGLSPRPSVTIP